MIIIFICSVLFTAVSPFKSQIYRFNEGLLLYNSSTGLNKQLFTNEPINRICMLQKQFFTRFQEAFSIRSRQGPFNVEAFSNTRQVLVTGIGTSKYDQVLDEYQSQIRILTKCRTDDISFLTYNLILKLMSSNQTTVVEIPVGLSCFPEAYSIRVEYIILQFLVGIIFIMLMLIFSNLSVSTCTIGYQLIHILLFILLPLLKTSYPFTLYVSTIFVYKFFLNSLSYFKIFKLIIFSCFLALSMLWLEMNFSLYTHYILNIVTIFVGLIVFKPQRFRHLVIMILIGVYSISYYKQTIGQSIPMQIILPALFKNQNYACVFFSVWDMLMPLLPSIFITRSFKSIVPIKNIHVLLHFVSFLGIGLFQALNKMSGASLKSMAGTSTVFILISSCVIALAQGNLSQLVTFKDSDGENM